MSVDQPTPVETRRVNRQCPDCELIRSLDPEIGRCPACYAEAGGA